MLIIHKTWCSACKAFKPKFAGSREAISLSKSMIMINVQDKEEPKDKKYSPDGGYVPRILFFNPNGVFLPNMYNLDGNPNYKYFYYDAETVVQTMRKVIDNYGSYNHNDEL